jgi:hypothetical protein
MGERAAGEEVKPKKQFGDKIGFKPEHVRRPLRRINMMKWEPSIDDVLARLSSPTSVPTGNAGTDDGGAGSNK